VSEAPETEIIGVFHDRDAVERAIETLQSHGIERGQLTILGTADAVRERLGMTVDAPGSSATADEQAPVDKSEEQNITPLLAGVPLYLGAVLAAGVTVASGGTLAGAAVAALAGAAGGGLVGGSAAGLFRGQVESGYEEQLAKGGILLLVHPRTAEDLDNAKAVLARHADRQVETEPDRSLT
jgi:hypothetical protein